MTGRLALALAAVALCGVAYAKGRYDGAALAEARGNAVLAEVQARHNAALAEVQAKQLALTKRMMRDVDALAQDGQNRANALAADRDAAAAAARGLRTALAQRGSGNTPAASDGNAEALSGALAQCAERYAALAGIADTTANQLLILQTWARVVAPQE
jgi:hypothetical protein